VGDGGGQGVGQKSNQAGAVMYEPVKANQMEVSCCSWLVMPLCTTLISLDFNISLFHQMG
jgi:hypothetical protein